MPVNFNQTFLKESMVEVEADPSPNQGGMGICNLEVCHSSAFQTISVRSIYIKNINHSGSVLANLNNTMQTKQHATKKHTHIQM